MVYGLSMPLLKDDNGLIYGACSSSVALKLDPKYVVWEKDMPQALFKKDEKLKQDPEEGS